MKVKFLILFIFMPSILLMNDVTCAKMIKKNMGKKIIQGMSYIFDCDE